MKLFKVSVHTNACAHRHQKVVSDVLEVRLQVVESPDLGAGK